VALKIFEFCAKKGQYKEIWLFIQHNL